MLVFITSRNNIETDFLILAYPENIECNWVIRVEPGKKVYVRILELQVSQLFLFDSSFIGCHQEAIM